MIGMFVSHLVKDFSNGQVDRVLGGFSFGISEILGGERGQRKASPYKERCFSCNTV